MVGKLGPGVHAEESMPNGLEEAREQCTGRGGVCLDAGDDGGYVLERGMVWWVGPRW